MRLLHREPTAGSQKATPISTSQQSIVETIYAVGPPAGLSLCHVPAGDLVMS